MGAVGVGGHHVDRGLDIFHWGALSLPVFIHQGIFLCHGADGLDAPAVAPAAGAGKGAQGNTALDIFLPVEVILPLPGGNGRQVGRVLGRNIELDHGVPGAAGHAHFPVAPGEGGEPLDAGAGVAGVQVAKILDVPFRHKAAPGIHLHNGIVIGDPVCGVGTLPTLEAREGALGHIFPLNAALQHVPDASLPGGAPTEDGRNRLVGEGAIDVHVDGGAVGQREVHIPLLENGAGQRGVALPADISLRKNGGAGLEPLVQ